jgi:serine/threonine-protein kinase
VLQSLQKDPQARYTSAAEMARSAREGRVVTGGIPVPATPAGGQAQNFGSDPTALLGAGVGAGNTAEQPTGQMASPDEEKSRALPWIITAAVVALVAVIGLLIWLNDRNREPANINENDTSPSVSQSSEPQPTSQEEVTSEDDDDHDNWQPSTEEETSESPSESPSETQSESPSETPDESPDPTTESPEPDPTTTPAGDPTSEADAS